MLHNNLIFNISDYVRGILQNRIIRAEADKEGQRAEWNPM
jgi:hypothetical protein